jgi:ribonuclease R
MPKKSLPSPLPTREQLLAFIADHPGSAGKREIARAFGIKGGDKIGLKRLLRDLADDGTVEKKRGKLIRPGDLPAVSVLAVTERTSDGELIATPAEWDDEAGDPPRILMLRPPRAARGARSAEPAPAVGDRVLARMTEGGGEMPTARVIKILQRQPEAVLGVVRKVGQVFRLEPVDRKQRETDLSPNALSGARDGDLVRATLTATGRRPGALAEVTEVIGPMRDEKAVSMIAIHAHEIPYEFPAEALAEAAKAKRAGVKDREDWRDLALVTIDPADAKDQRTTTTPFMPRPTTTSRTRGASSSPSRSPMSAGMYGPAPRSTGRRGSAAIRSTSPTASCRCYPSAFRTTSARSGSARIAQRSRCSSSSRQTGESSRTAFTAF